MKKIYVVRHCEAEGQHPEAPLTENGIKQAMELCEFLSNVNIDRIISSPYKRARHSIKPLAEKLCMEIEENSSLTERILSNQNLSDWLQKLRATFDDLELKFEGGESSQEAMMRVVKVVEEAFQSEYRNTIVVTHGNLISLLLKYFNPDFGFEEWRKLSNPDVYLLKMENQEVTYERLWK